MEDKKRKDVDLDEVEDLEEDIDFDEIDEIDDDEEIEDTKRRKDDEDDFDDYYNGDKKSKVSDALAVGMGIGIVNGLTGGAVLGGGSGGN